MRSVGRPSIAIVRNSVLLPQNPSGASAPSPLPGVDVPEPTPAGRTEGCEHSGGSLRPGQPGRARPNASSARRPRGRGPRGLSWPWRTGETLAGACKPPAWFGGARESRRASARGAWSSWGAEPGGGRGCPELGRGTAPAGGRRAGLPGVGVPAMCGAEAASGAATAAATGSASASRRCRRRRRRRRLLLRTWRARA